MELPATGYLNHSALLKTKKADVVEHPEVFDHVGLLVNRPSSHPGMPFVKSSDQLALS
jgi:hypothetical protein